MPVLTNFLSVRELEEEKANKEKVYVKKLNQFRKAVKLMDETFNIRVVKYHDIRNEILSREQKVYIECFDEVGYIPKKFEYSCFGDREYYNYLCCISEYPIVKLGDLKRLADELSLVILPMNYVNMDKIIQMYEKEDGNYAFRIEGAYNGFRDKVNYLDKNGIINQQLYMLAPISFYDPWEEVSC